ncbi:hypothetical protein GCM10008983_05570 [Lentibacillus halophilus]|uniref:Cytochrome c oxidase subunit 2A n=1 Tax=Lentibacillus halophilus TaxID=295065 RepID=A0ABN0Z487_9BACI
MSQNKPDKETSDHASYSLKGTFISVMLVGAFIIVSWAGVYGLFISR